MGPGRRSPSWMGVPEPERIDGRAAKRPLAPLVSRLFWPLCGETTLARLVSRSFWPLCGETTLARLVGWSFWRLCGETTLASGSPAAHRFVNPLILIGCSLVVLLRAGGSRAPHGGALVCRTDRAPTPGCDHADMTRSTPGDGHDSGQAVDGRASLASGADSGPPRRHPASESAACGWRMDPTGSACR